MARTFWEKEQNVVGEGDHRELGQHFSGTKILVLAPGGKHNTMQGKCEVRRSGVKRQVWTVEQTNYGVSKPPKPLKAL